MPYLVGLTDLRVCAGISKSDLAKEADVDRKTIAKIEHSEEARIETLAKLINALNRLYYREFDQPLSINQLVKDNPGHQPPTNGMEIGLR